MTDPTAIFLQPLGPSCRRQSVRRGFAISLPILIIYLLLYLLNFVSWNSKLGQQYKNTVVRFWSYQRHEGFQNVASLGTYVTSQFTHNGLIHLVIDSLVLIGVASILGSVFNRRMFFAVYVCGGFLAAAADCAWARLTNPSRNLTQAQINQVSTSASLINEALAKKAEIITSSQIFTYRGFVELLTNPTEHERKHSGEIEELRKQNKVIETNYPLVRDWHRWIKPYSAASGSLVCLLSVAALIRPRTIINMIGVRPSVLLYDMTAAILVFNLCMPSATLSSLNHQGCVGGDLAAVSLWFLWLRRGRIGTLSSGLKAFDTLYKPVRIFPLFWPVVFAGCILEAAAIIYANSATKKGAQDSKEARVPDLPQRADETGTTKTGDTDKGGANDRETQEEVAANQRAVENDDSASKVDKD